MVLLAMILVCVEAGGESQKYVEQTCFQNFPFILRLVRKLGSYYTYSHKALLGCGMSISMLMHLNAHYSSANSNHLYASLVEWVGSGAPVCEEQAEADSLEDSGQDANGNGIERSLLSDNSRDDLVKYVREAQYQEYPALTPGAADAKKIKEPR